MFSTANTADRNSGTASHSIPSIDSWGSGTKGYPAVQLVMQALAQRRQRPNRDEAGMSDEEVLNGVSGTSVFRCIVETGHSGRVGCRISGILIVN